jgi:hypothetical protein
MGLLNILALLPNLINGVEQIMGAFPGKGAVKKDMVMKGVGALLDGAKQLGVKVDSAEILAKASNYIDGYVSLQNTIGAFEKH